MFGASDLASQMGKVQLNVRFVIYALFHIKDVIIFFWSINGYSNSIMIINILIYQMVALRYINR